MAESVHKSSKYIAHIEQWDVVVESGTWQNWNKYDEMWINCELPSEKHRHDRDN